MAIEHDRTSSMDHRAVDASRRTEAESAAERPREAPPREQVDRFRQLMQGERRDARLPGQETLQPASPRAEAGRHSAVAEQGAGQEAVRAVHERDASREQGDQAGADTLAREGNELLSMLQAQAALRDGAAVPAHAPAAPMASGKALAEMLERHVRQLAVDEAASADGDGHILLRMSDATLPGTDLLLSRTADGWHLRADVRSRDSYDSIREAAPALARRFADMDLGRIEIDPHFNG